ncbi:hypothetical protein DSO57_1016207 [Entomophthora muscae]|uniref:Uncharacterized protein n=1 Tax=Entomophthora muscae TaxID=34485 RepID=A0ACC2UPR3_9FUNG|nr:hypothetical protein DSO57_1016207 [Entomophthora muscae]
MLFVWFLLSSLLYQLYVLKQPASSPGSRLRLFSNENILFVTKTFILVSTMASESKATQDGFFSSMFKDVIDSIFTPGVNSGLIRAMNISFIFLFVTLAAFAVITSFNIHVIALNFIAFGLFCSINWMKLCYF